jgi:4a-hydroxytetrahydrobiopterin dehydratase
VVVDFGFRLVRDNLQGHPMAEVAELAARHCEPCESGATPLENDAITLLMQALHGDWMLAADGKSILRTFVFADYSQTISFVNAVARIAEQQGHHPDLAVLYGRVDILYTTHSISGLSENDFICAAKIDHL